MNPLQAPRGSACTPLRRGWTDRRGRARA
jgi:hypothetical protein